MALTRRLVSPSIHLNRLASPVPLNRLASSTSFNRLTSPTPFNRLASPTPFNRLASHTPFNRPASHTSPKTASTVVGKSGRTYIQGEVLDYHLADPQLNHFKAQSGNESFVLRRVPTSFYELSQRLAAECVGSRRLQMHIDCNEEESILVYPYFKDTLFDMLQDDPDFPVAETLKVLRQAGEGIQELHNTDWIHADIKPENILVNWTRDQKGQKIVEQVALGRFDIAFKLEAGEPHLTPNPIRNTMWRSPEGHTGFGVTKASDIFSFGLACIHALGRGDLLVLQDYDELEERNMRPGQELLIRHFSYFGRDTKGLLQQIDDEEWREILKGASEIAEQVVKDQPNMLFERWGDEFGPEARNMISGMTNMDPTARTTADQVLAHRFWREVA